MTFHGQDGRSDTNGNYDGKHGCEGRWLIMAAKKTTTGTAARSEQTEPMFSKEQILASARFANRRDLVDALLDEDKSYTMKTVDNLVEKYMKGQVK